MALFGNKKKVEQLEFQVTELNKLYENIEGIDQTYYTYTYKGNARGSVKLIAKF